ncbi:TA system antitoxin ParD family protein [Corynebacterium glyciniphilum]|uniref:TA system antitoxin ParD family protein n=1 Tax=Corynebacterium glyciniphilum TaxID=1404244 RepID=UPI0016425388|nr:hypothetical protein [Corynebacterium glyciniphilum]
MSSSPTRLPDDVYDAATAVAPSNSRSTAQQIAHWARIGREFERAHNVNLRDIEAVLSGTRSYDDLTDREQAIARTRITERQEELRQSLNFEEEFRSQGLNSWVAGTPDGDLEMRGPSPQ